MSGVSIATIHLFDQYQIPTDNDNNFVCPYCHLTTRRSRRRWIIHVHIIHPIEFNNILESLRAVNTSIGKISENNPDEINCNNAFILLEENETSTTEEENDDKPIEIKFAELSEIYKSGQIDDKTFIAEVKKLFEKKNSS